MNEWLARYEEGYVTSRGVNVSLTNELYRGMPWTSPTEALSHWSTRKDLDGPNVERFGNGLQQFDDVRGRVEFSELGVATIWRRVTFEQEPQQGTAAGYTPSNRESASSPTTGIP